MTSWGSNFLNVKFYKMKAKHLGFAALALIMFNKLLFFAKHINMSLSHYVNSSILVMLLTEFIQLYSHRIAYQLIWKLSLAPVRYISLSSLLFGWYSTPTYFKQTNTLRQLLVKPKDPVSEENVVGSQAILFGRWKDFDLGWWVCTPLLPLPRPSTSQIIPPVGRTCV